MLSPRSLKCWVGGGVGWGGGGGGGGRGGGGVGVSSPSTTDRHPCIPVIIKNKNVDSPTIFLFVSAPSLFSEITGFFR